MKIGGFLKKTEYLRHRAFDATATVGRLGHPRADPECRLTLCSSGHTTACHPWASFHSGPSVSYRGVPLSSNVRFLMVAASAPASKQASSPQQTQSADWKLEVPIPLVAAGITILGAACVAWFAHRWSRTREAASRRALGAAKFREAFASDLVAVEHGNIGHLSLMDYLREAHNERHASAVVTFEPLIRGAKLTAFRHAWQRYRYGENEDGSPAAPDSDGMNHDDLYFLCYAENRGWETHIALSSQEKAIERMRTLIAYAAET